MNRPDQLGRQRAAAEECESTTPEMPVLLFMSLRIRHINGNYAFHGIEHVMMVMS